LFEHSPAIGGLSGKTGVSSSMRSSWIFLAAFGLASGCASQSPPAASSANTGVVMDNAPAPAELTGLGGSLAIAAEAPSWPALVEKLHPTLTVGNCDLIWVGKDERGQLQFTLDEAYLYHPPGQPQRWVLLNVLPDAPYDNFYGDVMGHNLRGVAKLMPKVPEPEYDGEICGDYAIVKTSHPAFGTVYEIGWEKLMANGSGHDAENRKLYILQDRRGQWCFLGEGVSAGQGRNGAGEQDSNDVESKVVWIAAQPPNFPVEIQFTEKDTCEEPDREEDESYQPKPDFVTYDDYVLVAPFPAQLRRTTSRPYALAAPGDTLEKIARLNAAWEADELKPSAEVYFEQIWREGLTRLNPSLPLTAALAPGTKVQLLNFDERTAAVINYDENIDLLPVPRQFLGLGAIPAKPKTG